MKMLVAEKLSPHKYKTPEGYLICKDAILARTGKQEYRKNELFADSDDSVIEVDRPAEEVFSDKTLASFENKPIVVEHPDEDVNSENYKDYAVGFVRDVRRAVVDGQDVMVGNLVITDAQTIEEIENGEHTDLSCGYDCDIRDEENPVQRNIRGNHVALCQEGRAGIARIVDSKMSDLEPTAENAWKYIKNNVGKYGIYDTFEGAFGYYRLKKEECVALVQRAKSAGLVRNDDVNGLMKVVNKLHDSVADSKYYEVKYNGRDRVARTGIVKADDSVSAKKKWNDAHPESEIEEIKELEELDAQNEMTKGVEFVDSKVKDAKFIYKWNGGKVEEITARNEEEATEIFSQKHPDVNLDEVYVQGASNASGNPWTDSVCDGQDDAIINTLLDTLNKYAQYYKNGNQSVLPAIGRIVEKLESMGKKVSVRGNKYVIDSTTKAEKLSKIIDALHNKVGDTECKDYYFSYNDYNKLYRKLTSKGYPEGQYLQNLALALMSYWQEKSGVKTKTASYANETTKNPWSIGVDKSGGFDDDPIKNYWNVIPQYTGKETIQTLIEKIKNKTL